MLFIVYMYIYTSSTGYHVIYTYACECRDYNYSNCIIFKDYLEQSKVLLLSNYHNYNSRTSLTIKIVWRSTEYYCICYTQICTRLAIDSDVVIFF